MICTSVPGWIETVKMEATVQLWFVWLLTLTTVSGVDIVTYSMKNYCNKTLEIAYMTTSFKLRLKQYNFGLEKQCGMHILASPIFNYRFYIRFLDIDIDCSRSNVRFYDGVSDMIHSPELGSRNCGQSNPGTFRTTGQDLYIKFTSSEYLRQDEFTLLISTFSEAPCQAFEVKCDNSWCIDYTLKCNGYDNCGDSTYHNCYNENKWWIWMVIGIVVFLIICVITTVVCCCIRRRAVKNSDQTVVRYQCGNQNITSIANPWYDSPTQHTQPMGAYPSPVSMYPTGQVQHQATYVPTPPAYTSVSSSFVYPPPQPASADLTPPPLYSEAIKM